MRERLRRERQLAGFSQAQLARMVGISQQTM
ncbi:MAG: helix-turn-helix domain-containing protein, partial [Candidatus Spyradenecus sp.]